MESSLAFMALSTILCMSSCFGSFSEQDGNCEVLIASSTRQTKTLEIVKPNVNDTAKTKTKLCALLKAARRSYIVLDTGILSGPSSDPQCRYNYAQAWDGNPTKSSLLVQWCDHRHVGYVMSTGPEMLVVVKITYYKFYFHHDLAFSYFSSPLGAVATLPMVGWKIFSPNYPRNYLPSVYLGWQINFEKDFPEEYKVVRLYVLDFVLEDSVKCAKDYLELRDGSLPSSPLIHKLCGNVKIPYVESTGPGMYLVFKTDTLSHFRGFKVACTHKLGKSEVVRDHVIGSDGDIVSYVLSFCAGMFILGALQEAFKKTKKIRSNRSETTGQSDVQIPLHSLS